MQKYFISLTRLIDEKPRVKNLKRLSLSAAVSILALILTAFGTKEPFYFERKYILNALRRFCFHENVTSSVLPSVTQVFLKQMFRAAEQASAFPLRPQG
jgi:hypothetical protein